MKPTRVLKANQGSWKSSELLATMSVMCRREVPATLRCRHGVDSDLSSALIKTGLRPTPTALHRRTGIQMAISSGQPTRRSQRIFRAVQHGALRPAAVPAGLRRRDRSDGIHGDEEYLYVRKLPAQNPFEKPATWTVRGERSLRVSALGRADRRGLRTGQLAVRRPA